MLDPAPLDRRVARRPATPVCHVDVLAAGFHEALGTATAGVAVELAGEHGLDTVVLTGGVFQNVRLTDLVESALADHAACGCSSTSRSPPTTAASASARPRSPPGAGDQRLSGSEERSGVTRDRESSSELADRLAGEAEADLRGWSRARAARSTSGGRAHRSRGARSRRGRRIAAAKMRSSGVSRLRRRFVWRVPRSCPARVELGAVRSGRPSGGGVGSSPEPPRPGPAPVARCTPMPATYSCRVRSTSSAQSARGAVDVSEQVGVVSPPIASRIGARPTHHSSSSSEISWSSRHEKRIGRPSGVPRSPSRRCRVGYRDPHVRRRPGRTRSRRTLRRRRRIDCRTSSPMPATAGCASQPIA